MPVAFKCAKWSANQQEGSEQIPLSGTIYGISSLMRVLVISVALVDERESPCLAVVSSSTLSIPRVACDAHEIVLAFQLILCLNCVQ